MTSTLRTDAAIHRTEHRAVVAASPDVTYDLIADATRWPVIFEPTVHVTQLERTATTEHFEIFAVVNGAVSPWRSHRTFDHPRHTITFEQDHSTPPLTSMAGEWVMLPTTDGGTEVVLTHRFSVVDDDPVAVAAMITALDANSARELGALARVAELGVPVDELVFDFEDTIALRGRAADAYEFVARGDLWAELLPHVASADLVEQDGGVQWLTMETVTPDGSEHVTRSVRLCTAPRTVVFKQTITPTVMMGHAGEWRFEDGPAGGTVTVRHQVALDPTAVAELLGPGASVQDARLWATSALRKNSRVTIGYANVFAEGRRTSGPTP